MKRIIQGNVLVALIASLVAWVKLARVPVARSLANQPSLALTDEPTDALDSQRGRQVEVDHGRKNEKIDCD